MVGNNLTDNEINSIKAQISEGKSIRDILSTQFPDRNIYIVMGVEIQSKGTHPTFVLEAYLDPLKATGRYKEDGSLEYIITVNVKALEEGKAEDTAMGLLFDSDKRYQVYKELGKSLQS